MRFDPGIDLEPEEEREFQTWVRCDEPPGDVTENAFAIFYVTWLNQPWRIFVRMKVSVGPDGTPRAVTESVTTQTVRSLPKDQL
jgi:hypothetical protein